MDDERQDDDDVEKGGDRGNNKKGGGKEGLSFGKEKKGRMEIVEGMVGFLY